MQGVKSPSRHYCDHADCGKSFRRAEHLTRHKLNHTNSTIPCPQCDRLFYRKDLLHRHLTLKHGEPPRGGRSNDAVQASVTVRPPHAVVADGPVHTTQHEQSPRGIAETVSFSHAPYASSAGHGPNSAALAISPDLFAFTTPSLELGQDWNWLNQSAIPGLSPNAPTISGQAAHPGLADIHQRVNEDWMSSASAQDVYISQDILDFVLAHPLVAESSHLFGHHQITSLLNGAFSFLAKALPIFHRPTFSFDLVRRELCMAVLCTGMLISDEDDLHRVGCALLGQTRSELLRYADANTIYLSDIGVLQALLLCEFAGMYLADRPAMELSDIFHGTLVTLCRRLGIFEAIQTEGRDASAMGSITDWQSPVEQECIKRLAYFVFALDVEQVLFFGHERSILSFYSMRLELPSEDRAVDNTAGESQAGQGPRPRVRFHILCHALLSRGEGQVAVPAGLTQFSLVMVLLGLTSVALDLLRRQHDPFLDTKQALSRLGTVLPAVYSRLMVGPDGSMKRRGQAIYHITVIALSTPMEDLEKAANDGFSRQGRTPKQHTRAALIRLLTRQKVGTEPARHAVQLLTLYLTPAHGGQRGVDQSPAGAEPGYSSYTPYETSALYLACLTLWAYVMGRVGDSNDLDAQFNGDGYLADCDLDEQEIPDGSSPGSMTSAVLLDGMAAAIDKSDMTACQSHWRKIAQRAAARLASIRNSNAQEYSQVLRSLSEVQSF